MKVLLIVAATIVLATGCLPRTATTTLAPVKLLPAASCYARLADVRTPPVLVPTYLPAAVKKAGCPEVTLRSRSARPATYDLRWAGDEVALAFGAGTSAKVPDDVPDSKVERARTPFRAGTARVANYEAANGRTETLITWDELGLSYYIRSSRYASDELLRIGASMVTLGAPNTR